MRLVPSCNKLHFYILQCHGMAIECKELLCRTLKIHLIRERFEKIGLKYTNTKEEGNKLEPKCYFCLSSQDSLESAFRQKGSLKPRTPNAY